MFPLGAFNILCPLLSGVVAENFGVKWMFKLMPIFAGIEYAFLYSAAEHEGSQLMLNDRSSIVIFYILERMPCRLGT